jgi:radical SAM protein with 4Fe4S-binding SPASM domain
MTEEIKRILKEYSEKVELSIQLSIDGIEESHDMYRKYRDGTGSFKQIEKNLKAFQEITDNIVIHGCVNKKNLKYLYQNYKYFKDKGFKKIWYMLIHEEEWQPEDVELYDTMLERIYLSGINNLEDLINTYSPFDKCTFCLDDPHIPCGAGKNYISITADGDIYPCQRLYFYDKNTKCGSIETGIEETELQQTLENYTAEDMSCKNCTHVNCYRCPAVNYEINKDPLKQVQGNYCRMSKIEQEYQMRLLAEIINRVGENNG